MDIPSLISRAQELAVKVDFWNNLILILMLLTAVFAGGLVWVQRMAFQRSRELTAANEARDAAILEKERAKRLQLEKALSPRLIPLLFRDGKWNIDPLKPFAGLQVMFEFLPDAEAARATAEIEEALRVAGWKIVSVTPNPQLNTGFFEGVVIEPHRVPGPFMPTPEQNRAEEAGKALRNFLASIGWLKAKTTPAMASIPPNTIRIRVGFKPSPYFMEKRQELEKMLESLRKN